MGLFKMSTSSYNCNTTSKSNPNPLNYKILRAKQIENYLLIKINYPDCKNYEGDKILLYKDCTKDSLIKQ